MLGSRFDLDETIAAIAAKRELDLKATTQAQPFTDFDSKLKAFVDVLTRETSSKGIFTTPIVERHRTRL